MIRLDVNNCNMVLTKKLQKKLTLSSGRIDNYEYLIGKEIVASDQSRTIEQGKFTYSPLGKDLEKQRKVNEDQGKKQKQLKIETKTIFRHRSKINCLFVFKRFLK